MALMNHGIDRLGFLVHDVARALRKRFEERARAVGVSSAHWRLLVRVVKEEGTTQARLAELLEIEPISVSRLLDRMEESGWIERRQHANDRRVRTIYPTVKALEAYGTVKSVAGEVYEEALKGVSGGDRATLIRALDAITINLSDSSPAAADSAAANNRKYG
jgi:MarR family transcriptional regulator, transcriptional regulator for hemolysin